MGDVIPFSCGQGQPLSSRRLRSYRDARSPRSTSRWRRWTIHRPALAPGVDAAGASLLAVRDPLSGLDLGPASLAVSRPERLRRIAAGLPPVGRHPAELAEAAAGLLAHTIAGRATAP